MVERSLSEKVKENNDNKHWEFYDEDIVLVLVDYCVETQKKKGSQTVDKKTEGSGDTPEFFSHCLCDHHLTNSKVGV